jgi:hypothetical protein
MKINIQKIETFTITHTTREFDFEMDEFRNCTPAFIGKTPKEFMDYLTNDIEINKDFLGDNIDVLTRETYHKLYMLDVDPIYEVMEDSRCQYEDSWFTMTPHITPQIEIKDSQTEKIVK